MGYIALYRKYRPSTLDEVVGQNKIIQTIKNSILNNKLSHAYLFSGPRGTGKTSTAKIIAKMINCENLIDGVPCDKCQSCIDINNNNDIIEIDAASNNGVDEIRELRDKINLVPLSCKYKVYIIDEVHMLTTQAFNALLKTLEEPPSHAIFILATTEPHKIPITIMSRCQKFQFYKIDDSIIIDRLKYIAEKEKIVVSDDALNEIARLADGGMRDAINILDQLVAYKNTNIELEDVYEVNGIVSYLEMYDLLMDIRNSNNKNIIDFIEKINKQGKSISKFIEELILFLKDIIVYINTKTLTDVKSKNEKIIEISNNYNENEIYKLLILLNDTLNNIKISNYPAILLITSLLTYVYENNNSLEKLENQKEDEKTELIKKSNNDLKITKKEDKIISREIISDNNLTPINENDKKNRINNTFATASKSNLLKIKQDWNKIKDYFTDDKYSLIVGLLEDVLPVAAGENNLIIVSKINSIVERINNNIEEVEKLINKIYNANFLIVALSNAEWQKEKETYIKNINSGYKYEIIISESKESSKKNKTTQKLEKLLGEELIEYK